MLQALDGAKGAEGSAEDAFATLKDLTIYGYFTSEIVMKDVSRHQVIPGRFDGCIPV
jgi:gluconate 2-dehydrogenase subunit 3-like protein